jgi:hypothetical protein
MTPLATGNADVELLTYGGEPCHQVPTIQEGICPWARRIGAKSENGRGIGQSSRYPKDQAAFWPSFLPVAIKVVSFILSAVRYTDMFLGMESVPKFGGDD